MELENEKSKFGLVMLIIPIVLILMITAGLVKKVTEVDPKSALNMSKHQREDNDNQVLLEQLQQYEVEKVEIDYTSDTIKVYLAAESVEQYVDDKAKDVIDIVPVILEDNRAELTLEKDSNDYSISVFGKDGRLIDYIIGF